jgi:pimeloyl-ACP methyl ester carboxylesterase
MDNRDGTKTLARLLADGTGVHVEEHGQGSPILLTHGFGSTCRMWDEQIEELTDRHRLIVWDLPGHGLSAPPTRRTTPDNVVTRMSLILDTAGASKAVLIGLGVGGQLTLRFWRAYPERVRAMVLIGTLPGLRSVAARELWNAQVTRLAEAVEQSGLEALGGGMEVDPVQQHDPVALANTARLLLTQSDEGALPFLDRIDVPVLILVGGNDRPNRGAADHMARVIPGARLVVVPRAEHAANLHRPRPVNEAIRAFLDSIRNGNRTAQPSTIE